MKKLKIKEIYLEELENGGLIPVYVTTSGKKYTWYYQATGNCWITYVLSKKEVDKLES